ncbi:MAG: peptidoglycan bridge formation glycyltransferase FemA/FemB family protein [Anaerolineales bacterium]|jgi:lipid II:glycine glycyltransferase (peptidoglycan interpeptide bridge formation enzyme)
MDAETWNALVAKLPKAHILQTWEWGQIKAKYGWNPIPLLWVRDNERQDVDGIQTIDLSVSQKGGMNRHSSFVRRSHAALLRSTQPLAAALVLKRSISFGGVTARLTVMYIPKAPVLQDWEDLALRRRVLEDLHALGHQHGAIFVKIDPDVTIGTGEPNTPESQEDPTGIDIKEQLINRGWIFSSEQVQFRNTVLVDLTPTEEELLAKMKQKTRYNIRLAGRRGVVVRVGDENDLDLLYKMYAETSVRDGFVIRDKDYYSTVWSTYIRNNYTNSDQSAHPNAEPLIAEVEGEPVAALVIFRFGGSAWYLHGMSRPVHRKKMPNYLLQWEAMCRAKSAGCKIYNLWGAPDDFSEKDPMWGVYRFKSGFGGYVLRTIGAWDLPIRPFWYKVYTQLLPRLLNVLRHRGVKRTKLVVLD